MTHKSFVRFDLAQQKAQAAAEDLRAFQSGKLRQPAENLPIRDGQPNGGFSHTELEAKKPSGVTSKRYGEGVAITESSQESEYAAPPIAPDADRLAFDWLLTPKSAEVSLSERILARLIQSEAHEAEASFRDDYRIAWITVMHASKGDCVECSPHVLATYQVLGCHPDQVYDRMMIRRAAAFGTEANRVSFTSARTRPQNPLTEPTGAGAPLSPKPAPVPSSKRRLA